MTVRAIEHVGLTVPDLEEATTFFAEAFGAVKLYDMIDEPLSGPAIESGLGVPGGRDDRGDPNAAAGRRPEPGAVHVLRCGPT